MLEHSKPPTVKAIENHLADTAARPEAQNS